MSRRDAVMTSAGLSAGHRPLPARDVAAMAHQAGVSPRTFARRFRHETGTTPLQWLLAQRVLEARCLLEETDLPIDAVAWRAGFGTAASLRDHFRRVTATTPTAYRAFLPADRDLTLVC
jgi:AraC family transcriptional activator FtrA